ncbi:hypothetical protein GF318_04920 [Candidatus Micrarchaeota archaeon]|nr:hypothetical protein [Candidatus Micrarchaeota archaeon]
MRKIHASAIEEPRKKANPEPLSEGIRKPRPRGFFAKMSDEELVDFAQKYIDGNGIKSRSALAKADNGLYQTLGKRKLAGRVKLEADERLWARYPDDELIAYVQGYVDRNGIRSRTELAEKASGPYFALWRRKLLGGVKLKADERAWRNYPDNQLVAYAQKFVDENGIESRYGLRMADCGLIKALWERKLLDNVKFTKDKKAWKLYSDEELVDYAQNFADDNGILKISMLRKAGDSLYRALRRRNLIPKIDFAAGNRSWKGFSDDKLVEYAKKHAAENDIESRTGLFRSDGSMYHILRKRKLLDRVFDNLDEDG